eukprot:SAG11_NODE_942_length_6435_cov_27.522096_8_plen_83_part_00
MASRLLASGRICSSITDGSMLLLYHLQSQAPLNLGRCAVCGQVGKAVRDAIAAKEVTRYAAQRRPAPAGAAVRRPQDLGSGT